MDYDTISLQPIDVYLLCIWILVHNPYARFPPFDVFFLPVFVCAVELLLLTQP